MNSILITLYVLLYAIKTDQYQTFLMYTTLVVVSFQQSPCLNGHDDYSLAIIIVKEERHFQLQ